MSQGNGNRYISFEELQFKDDFHTNSFPSKPYKPLIESTTYDALEYYDGEGTVFKAHVLELEFQKKWQILGKWCIVAYIVTLEEEKEKMKRIAADKIYKLDKQDLVEAQGKIACNSYNDWIKSGEDCCSMGQAREKNPSWKNYYQQPSYKRSKNNLFQPHPQPERGDNVVRQDVLALVRVAHATPKKPGNQSIGLMFG